MSPADAATTLQKYARGYLARKRVKVIRQDGDVFVGMAMPPPHPKGKDPIAKAAETVSRRHATQEQYVLTISLSSFGTHLTRIAYRSTTVISLA